MTFKDKLKLEKPELIDDEFAGGVRPCPDHVFPDAHILCPSEGIRWPENKKCTKCWEQRIEGPVNVDGAASAEPAKEPVENTDVSNNDILNFITKLADGLRIAFGGEGRRVPEIKKVIFNDPATIIFWEDGTKTVVKATNEEFDPEKGLAMAISRKALGNTGSYFNEFEKWLDTYNAYEAKTTTLNLKLPNCQEAINAIKQLGEKLKKENNQ